MASGLTCDCAEFITDAACFSTLTINPKQQKALLVYFRVFELFSLGGTDYRTTKHTTLVTDAMQACCGMNPNRRIAANLALAMDRAIGASTASIAITGAASGVATTINTQVAQIACIQHLPDETLDQMILFLDCKIADIFYV